ncbi:MAG: hypothetical protein A6F70_06575 [Cycloclasticus sp. symbiont of Bathymodiolus heckerae]|nr:MAG: hypothetical protein A6F70_06575 [Cycloclasticus sp. symbiont of Bathymodiolus heckerae]
MAKKLLQIFAKAPVIGNVKTRLIRDIGAQAACDVYLELLNKTLGLVEGSEFKVELWCAPDDNHEFFQQCVNKYDVELRNQCGGDLGERMQYALSAGLNQYSNVVLIGADCPVFSMTYLMSAFETLSSVDVVFGPAEDGGFVLVGCRKAPSNLFNDMTWSGTDVLAEALRLTDNLGLSSHRLATLWDVDVIDDLKRWRVS